MNSQSQAAVTLYSLSLGDCPLCITTDSLYLKRTTPCYRTEAWHRWQRCLRQKWEKHWSRRSALTLGSRSCQQRINSPCFRSCRFDYSGLLLDNKQPLAAKCQIYHCKMAIIAHISKSVLLHLRVIRGQVLIAFPVQLWNPASARWKRFDLVSFLSHPFRYMHRILLD